VHGRLTLAFQKLSLDYQRRRNFGSLNKSNEIKNIYIDKPVDELAHTLLSFNRPTRPHRILQQQYRAYTDYSQFSLGEVTPHLLPEF